MNTLLFIPIAYLLVVSIPIVIADLSVARVPNKYTLPALYLWLICATTYAVLSGDWLWSLILPIVFGVATLLVGVYFGGKGTIGMGDVKLLVFMGLSLSWKSAWVWLLLPAGSLVIAFVIFAFYYFTRTNKLSISLAPAIYLVYLILTATLFIN
jgi:Flp pilus assembly protein protease CpaA